MRLLADENIERGMVKTLRSKGHDIKAISEISPRASDEEVLAIARKERRLLLTRDKDFGDMVHRQFKLSSGVLLIRFSGLNLKSQERLLLAVLKQYGDKLNHHFSTLSESGLRNRPMRIK